MTNMDFSEIIALAIQRETEAIAFYRELAGNPQNRSIKDTLDWIGAQEEGHKAFLVSYRDRRQDPQALKARSSINYRIAEYLEEPPAGAMHDDADVFLMASHRELRSYKFYRELANRHPEGSLRTALLKIADEELSHKEKMEYLYSNTAFPQTAGG